MDWMCARRALRREKNVARGTAADAIVAVMEDLNASFTPEEEDEAERHGWPESSPMWLDLSLAPTFRPYQPVNQGCRRRPCDEASTSFENLTPVKSPKRDPVVGVAPVRVVAVATGHSAANVLPEEAQDLSVRKSGARCAMVMPPVAEMDCLPSTSAVAGGTGMRPSIFKTQRRGIREVVAVTSKVLREEFGQRGFRDGLRPLDSVNYFPDRIYLSSPSKSVTVTTVLVDAVVSANEEVKDEVLPQPSAQDAISEPAVLSNEVNVSILGDCATGPLTACAAVVAPAGSAVGGANEDPFADLGPMEEGDTLADLEEFIASVMGNVSSMLPEQDVEQLLSAAAENQEGSEIYGAVDSSAANVLPPAVLADEAVIAVEVPLTSVPAAEHASPQL